MSATSLRIAGFLSLTLLSPAAIAGTLYVDANLVTGLNDGSSWADAFQGPDGLQAALGVVASGDDIFVAEGTYRPSATGNRVTRFRLKNGVAIYGGFLGTEATPDERPPFGTAPSILSGDLNGDDGGGTISDNSYHLIGAGGTDATAVIDGFVVTGGNANGGGSNNDRGGGILITGGVSPTIRKCHFIGNRCTFGGGAGYINGSAPTFTDCIFESNTGGSFGGAFDIATAGAVRFDRCQFLDNFAVRAGALEIFATSGVVVTNSVFRENTCASGGGGAIWMGSGGNTLVRNCTIVGNVATAQAVGGLRVQGSAPTVANCIFWDNEGSTGAQGPFNQITAGTDVTYSIVEGGYAGTGNLAGDPSFEDIGAGDFDLTLASPGIDAGNNAGVPAGITLDAALDPRFVDEPSVADTGAGAAPIVDMGAFEFQGVGGGVGMSYCSSTPNSTGLASTISGSGSASIAANDLVLSADNHPDQVGIFIAGPTQAAIPFFNGLLCVDPSGLQRFSTIATPVAGVATEAVDYATSAPGGLNVVAGSSHHFQRWFRDPLAGGGFANFSDGLEVLMQP